MRLHSACHLLFGAARKMFSHVNYAGFNIGKLGNLYLETGQQITAEQLREMQLLANECVVDNRPISSYWVDTQKAASLPGLAYNLELPDKQVRIIDIDGWDVAACSGTHLHNTVEIGPIKVVAREIHKKNVTRIDYAVGKSAVAAIAEDDKVVGETAVFLGTSKDQLNQIVRKLSSDLQGTQKSLRELRELVMEYKTRELLQGGETIEGTQLIVTAADYLDAKSLRVFASQLVAQRDSLVAAVIGGDDELTVVAACSQNVNINLVEPIVRVASKYGGGGGGRPNLVSAGGIKGVVQAVQNDVESELKRMLQNAPK
jgi:alanyl-tRNA synthetase